jgi:hypothetical protein
MCCADVLSFHINFRCDLSWLSTKNCIITEICMENILTNTLPTVDWIPIVTKKTVFTMRALREVGARLDTLTAIGRACAVSITLAS